jgi:hypothetical protein
MEGATGGCIRAARRLAVVCHHNTGLKEETKKISFLPASGTYDVVSSAVLFLLFGFVCLFFF